MFDYVDVTDLDLKCLKCQQSLAKAEWQAKRYCYGDLIHWSETDNFYTRCKACGHWNEYERKKSKLAAEEFEKNYRII